jgi:hypothetical protein
VPGQVGSPVVTAAAVATLRRGGSGEESMPRPCPAPPRRILSEIMENGLAFSQI